VCIAPIRFAQADGAVAPDQPAPFLLATSGEPAFALSAALGDAFFD